MHTVKEEVHSILNRLPDNCTLEDVQYHLYVVEKIQKGIEREKNEGAISQEVVEKRLDKWITE